LSARSRPQGLRCSFRRGLESSWKEKKEQHIEKQLEQNRITNIDNKSQ
jgi:hypothetical protein